MVDNLEDAVALLLSASPSPAPAQDPHTPSGTMPLTPAQPSTSTRTYAYNLRSRKGPEGPSALSASVRATSADFIPAPVPAYAPVTVAEAVGRRDWCATPPKTPLETLSRPDAYLWEAAKNYEYKTLVEKETGTIVQLPRGARWMRGKWVFVYKHDADEKVMWYKARYVGFG